MIRFDCDYTEGAHPQIIKRIAETNFEQTCGYGLDDYSNSAREKIKLACENTNIDVHFLVGGTQANTVVISSILRPHQGIISADTGHIATHESGAIESTGHKVLSIENSEGKISATQVEKMIVDHKNDVTKEHCVQPGMVYISFPSESGTLYTKEELSDLYTLCQKYDIPLFIDGARMGYGLLAETNNCTLKDICDLCDVFYIGGTKVGALFGEAVVIKKESLKKDFRYLIKRHGGLLAKGRLLGIQFDTLFSDNLYYQISKHAIDMAIKIKKAAVKLNYTLYADSYTNQQFIILSNTQLSQLEKKYAFALWEKHEDTSVVRICTSWATKEENVDQLISDLKKVA